MAKEQRTLRRALLRSRSRAEPGTFPEVLSLWQILCLTGGRARPQQRSEFALSPLLQVQRDKSLARSVTRFPQLERT